MARINGGLSKPNPNVESVFMSAVYRACVKVHNHSLEDETWLKKFNDTSQNPDKPDTDFGAIMYISVVLLFYSTGIIIMIVKYLKTEKAEMEEELALERFFKHMPNQKTDKEHHVNKMAIRAFHTLTSGGHGQVARREIPGESSSSRYSMVNGKTPKTLLVTEV